MIFNILRRLKKLENGLQTVCSHKYSSNSFKKQRTGSLSECYYKVCDICGMDTTMRRNDWNKQKKEAKINELELDINYVKESILW